MKQEINIVWLKRDLRNEDHAPFAAAEKSPLPYLIIYLFEPQFVDSPDTSLRHLQFQYHSILTMNRRMRVVEKEVALFYANAQQVFAYLTEQFNVKEVWSYQESGTQSTWERDKEIKRILHVGSVKWTECERDGVQRGIRDRENWETHFYTFIKQPILENSYSKRATITFNHPFPLPKKLSDRLKEYPSEFQPAGELYAWKYLRSFLKARGFSYQKMISKPTESRIHCGRLSPYLAWGNISVRQVYQYVRLDTAFEQHKRALNAFLTRLIWRSHFVQKFEVECAYETICVNRGYELLIHEEKAEYISAWKLGETGYPLVDACMRCVQKTGWINFRMRAMVVSFLCHQLDQDWRSGAHYLAQLFLDYEPGIHYPQFQMQAGTTGTNTVRMYNPVKQSQDHDPHGIFIKKWIPELRAINEKYIHEPWTMPILEQLFCGVEIGNDYPFPIVDHVTSARISREKIWSHRKHKSVQAEKERIIRTHIRKK